MKKILRIDLAKKEFSFGDVPSQYSNLGGRGLSSKIISEEVAATCDPLGKENKIVFAPGILSGSRVLCSGRLSVGTKSPLTGTIKEANAGGAVANQLARLGVYALIIEGEAAEATMIQVDSKGVAFSSAQHLEGKGVYECLETLRGTQDAEAGVVVIGPAGEMQLKASAIAVSTRDGHARFAARGGVGAVMGSKNLKAIVIDDTGSDKVVFADGEKLDAAAKALAQGVLAHPLMGALKGLGTPVLVDMINGVGVLPTKNYSQGTFEQADQLSGETLAGIMGSRPNSKNSHGCMKECPIHCSNVLTDESGDLVCASIEFETLALMGSNCMIADVEMVARLNRVCNDLGLDTMDVGGAVALAMEADMIPWGDGDAAISLINEIYAGTENGKMIGNGTQFTGDKLGSKRIPTVKGQCMAGYDPRGLKGTGTTYATSTMGADHTCGNALPSPANPDYNPGASTGQAPVSKFLQHYFAAIDSLGLCLFAALPILDIPDLKQFVVDAAAAAMGESVDDQFVETLGESVIQVERKFNLDAGFTSKDDRLPEFFTKEPLPGSEYVFDVSEEELDSTHN